MPVFSILTPTYNHENFLEVCIRSAISQTFQDWEMIILDDGSADRTGDIALQWAAQEKRIRYCHQENKGIDSLAETYNTGLSMAQGRYICILEGDDLWKPDKLQRQFDILENHPEVIVTWGRAEALVSDTSTIERISPPHGIPDDPGWPNQPPGVVLNQLYIENMIPAVTLAIRKSALQVIGGFKQPTGFPTTDLPTLADLALRGAFFFDREILAQWRIYSSQTTKRYPVEMVKSRWQFVREHLEKLDPPYRANLWISTRDIDRHFHSRLMIAYASSGRYRLIRKEFREARKDYSRAIFYPGARNFAWRIRAIIGWVFSLFHWNVEALTRKLGKISYQ